jgi:hypothetical protein
MGTIKFKGLGIFRGTHYGSVGVYTHADGSTYAGGRKEHARSDSTAASDQTRMTCTAQFERNI